MHLCMVEFGYTFLPVMAELLAERSFVINRRVCCQNRRLMSEVARMMLLKMTRRQHCCFMKIAVESNEIKWDLLVS